MGKRGRVAAIAMAAALTWLVLSTPQRDVNSSEDPCTNDGGPAQSCESAEWRMPDGFSVDLSGLSDARMRQARVVFYDELERCLMDAGIAGALGVSSDLDNNSEARDGLLACINSARIGEEQFFKDS